MRAVKAAFGVFLATVLIWGCAPKGEVKEGAYKHPEVAEQWTACSDCHKTETPEVYQEWHESRHGIAMVKCFQCHGTFETFQKPTRETCRSCHAKEYEACPKDKTCWECHSAHEFSVPKK